MKNLKKIALFQLVAFLSMSIGQEKVAPIKIGLWAPLSNMNREYRVLGDSLFDLQRPFEVFDYLHSETIEILGQIEFIRILPKETLDSLVTLTKLIGLKGVEKVSCDVLDGYALSISYDSTQFECYNCLFCVNKEDKERVERIHRLAYLVID